MQSHLKLATCQIIEGPLKGYNLGTQEDLRKEKVTRQRTINIPYREYAVYCPVVGVRKKLLGNHGINTSSPDYNETFLSLTNALLQQPMSGLPSELIPQIEQAFEKFDVLRALVIDELYHNIEKFSARIFLTLNIPYRSWEQDKEKILKLYAPLFNLLIAAGATYHMLSVDPNRVARYYDLNNYVMDSESLAVDVLSRVEIKDDLNTFEKTLDFCLSKGVDINTWVDDEPNYGTHLHYHLAAETSHIMDLIQLIESKRKAGQPHTQFVYTNKDGYGRTPLLLAINMRNEEAALALLDLEEKNIRVGLEVADSERRTPLLLAAALGMPKVVEKLLSLGANRNARDSQNQGLTTYAQLSESDTAEILAPLMHPYRCNVDGNYGYSNLVYLDEDHTPLCFYETKEGDINFEQEGENQIPHLVVLSNHPPFDEILIKVINHLRKRAERGDQWAENLLPYVLQQVENIKGKLPVAMLCLEGQVKVRKILNMESKMDERIDHDSFVTLYKLAKMVAKHSSGLFKPAAASGNGHSGVTQSPRAEVSASCARPKV